MLIPRRALTLIVIFILISTIIGQAQEKLSSGTELLRAKIEQLEKTDIKSKSQSVQEIYKATLLRLYNQLNAALLQDVADLKNIQSIANGTSSDPQNDLTPQINKLKVEQEIVAEKIQTLTGDASTNTSTSAPASQTTPTEQDTRLVSSLLTGVKSDSQHKRVGQPNTASLASVGNSAPSNNDSGSASEQTAGPIIKGQVILASKKYGAYARETYSQGSGKNRSSANPNDVPLNNLTVILRDNAGNKVLTTQTKDESGNYEFPPLPAIESTPTTYTLSTEADDETTKREIVLRDNGPISLDILVEDRPVSLLARAIVGYEQAGASSADKAQKYFFDLYLSHPLPFHQSIDPNFGEKWKIWGDVRVSSVPQLNDLGIGAFATSFVEKASGVKVSEAAQVVDFLAGVEYRFAGNPDLLPSFDQQTKQKFSLSFIAGFGAITPTSPRETIQVFKVSPGASGLPLGLQGKDFVAFVSSDRDRFFRQYYGGLRLQTFFFNKRNVPIQRFPTMLDVMYGQSEFATGGRLRGGVFRLDGYFPLPYEGLKFINLFGSAVLKPSRTKITEPLILEPAPAGTTVPASNVGIIAVPQANRDYYRVGVGIDFVSFIDSLKKLGKK